VIPGKKYKPEDFLEIAWRRRWVILVPLVLMSAGTFIWVARLPDTYRSEAVVQILSPRLPETYMRTPDVDSLRKRLDTMRQELLSVARLQALIEEFNLYPKERKTKFMDALVGQMRRDINVSVARVGRREDPGSFTVSYTSDNPKSAQAVAERLASLFVRANLESRAVQVDLTAQFLESELEAARQRLADQEAKLESFRRANAGKLPNEVESNLHAMNATQQQLQTIGTSINQDRDRQLVIDRTISEETTLAAAAVRPAPASPKPENLANASAAVQLSAAEAQLKELGFRLTDDHPDMRALRRRIRDLKEKAAAEALQMPVSDGVAVALKEGDLARQRRISTLKIEYETLERRIQSKREQAEKLQDLLASYRVRLDAAPGLEPEFSRLMRDRNTLEETYKTLLTKREQARMSASVEQRQVGEQFRILDNARLPQRPTGPDRTRMDLMGSLAGLGIGLVLAALLEYRDRSLRTEDDVVLTLALPVLALVPTMVTRIERLKQRRRRFLLASSGAAFALVGLVIAWKLQILTGWLR
jgi:polysaccharide chain length determinant protein (PEP-CTERM system associated)